MQTKSWESKPRRENGHEHQEAVETGTGVKVGE